MTKIKSHAIVKATTKAITPNSWNKCGLYKHTTEVLNKCNQIHNITEGEECLHGYSSLIVNCTNETNLVKPLFKLSGIVIQLSFRKSLWKGSGSIRDSLKALGTELQYDNIFLKTSLARIGAHSTSISPDTCKVK